MPLFSSNSNPSSGEPYGPPNDEDSSFNALVGPYKPLLQKLTLSSVMGYCSAITAKKIGKGIAFVAGLGFLALQGLAYKGIVDVNWKELEKNVANAVDMVSWFDYKHLRALLSPICPTAYNCNHSYSCIDDWTMRNAQRTTMEKLRRRI